MSQNSIRGEEVRNAKARECGYRDWEHLINATRNEPSRDIAAMTGYSLPSIVKWRQRFNVEVGRNLGPPLKRFEPRMTERDSRRQIVLDEKGADMKTDRRVEVVQDQDLLDLYDAAARRKCNNWQEADERERDLEAIQAELRRRNLSW